jgi:hypothetical protein
MIAMKFTIELGIGLSVLLQAALPQLVTDRDKKTHRRGQSKRSYGHCRRRTEIPQAQPQPDTPDLGHHWTAAWLFVEAAKSRIPGTDRFSMRAGYP